MASFVSPSSNGLQKYKWEDFNKYIQDIRDLLNDTNVSSVNSSTVYDNIEKQWKEFDASTDIKNICKNYLPKSFTGMDEATEYFNKLSNISSSSTIIPYIPDCYNQVVLGTTKYLAPYFQYNQTNEKQIFLILSDANWSIESNNIYLRCAIRRQFNDCEYPVRVLLPKDKTELFNNKIPRVTIYELFILDQMLIRDNNDTTINNKKKLNNLWIDTSSYIDHDILLIKNPYFQKKNGGKKQTRKNKKRKPIHKYFIQSRNVKRTTKRKTINKRKRLIS